MGYSATFMGSTGLCWLYRKCNRNVKNQSHKKKIEVSPKKMALRTNSALDAMF